MVSTRSLGDWFLRGVSVIPVVDAGYYLIDMRIPARKYHTCMELTRGRLKGRFDV
jgi:hypothetical protein